MSKVPIRSYVNTVALVMAIGFAAIIFTLDRKNGEAVDRALVAQEKATKVAFEAAEAKGIQHNGLIDRMREMSGQFVTRGNIFSALIAVGAVVTIYATMTGRVHP
jgi:hypothetical protein